MECGRSSRDILGILSFLVNLALVEGDRKWSCSGKNSPFSGVEVMRIFQRAEVCVEESCSYEPALELFESDENNDVKVDLIVLDEQIACKDCGISFLFSADEKRYFASKKLRNKPRRCHNCRVLRRARSAGDDNSIHLSALVCMGCNLLTYVPFKPDGRKPVYCVSCKYKYRADDKYVS